MKNKKSKLAVTLASSALLAGGLGACSEKPAQGQPQGSLTPVIPAAKLAGLSKAELKKMLAKIETAKAPQPKMGAMCYDMAAPPERMEYVCPACGEKTLYPREVSWKWAYKLDYCRQLFKRLPHHQAMALDESSFCKKCQPNAKEPVLNLVVRYDSGSTNIVANVSDQDLRLLNDFLNGRLLVEREQGAQSPIKEHLPRLRRLLGLDKETTKP